MFKEHPAEQPQPAEHLDECYGRSGLRGMRTEHLHSGGEMCIRDRDYVLKAAETRDPEALVEKARLLIKGEDLEPDPKMALNILTDLEENQTHAVPGMHFLLGYLHEEGLGTPQDMACLLYTSCPLNKFFQTFLPFTFTIFSPCFL